MIAIPEIPVHLRRPLALSGYPVFALFVLLLTFYLALPRGRVKEQLEMQLSADPSTGQPLALGMDTTVGNLALTLFSGPGLKLRDVVLKSRPALPTEKPVRYLIDDVVVHIGLFGYLFHRPAYHFTGHLLQGSTTGMLAYAGEDVRLGTEVSGVVLNGVPAVQGAVGLPLDGSVAAKLEVLVPKGQVSNTNGSFDLTIDNFALGDGKAKLTVAGDPFLSQGITFPRINLGRLQAHVRVEKGRAQFDPVRVHSADGDVTLEGYIELRDPLMFSQVHAYLKFRPSEALTKREPTVELMNNALAATAKRSDGYLGFTLNGTLGGIVPTPSLEAPPMLRAPFSNPAITSTPHRLPPRGTHAPPVPPAGATQLVSPTDPNAETSAPMPPAAGGGAPVGDPAGSARSNILRNLESAAPGGTPKLSEDFPNGVPGMTPPPPSPPPPQPPESGNAPPE